MSGDPAIFWRLFSPLVVRELAFYYTVGETYFSRADGRSFSDLFDREMFAAACKTAPSLRVSYASSDRGSMTPSVPIDAFSIEPHYSSGGTICVTGVDQVFKHLKDLSSRCKRVLGYTGDVDCRAYMSGDRAGYTPHFDDKTVLTMQIEGSKLWRVAPTRAVEHPINNAGRFQDGVFRYFGEQHTTDGWEAFDQPDFPDNSRTYLLNPGDILMVPAGTWHAAEAVDHSLSLALTLNHIKSGSTLDIVVTSLRRRLLAYSTWRAAPPLAFDDNASASMVMLEEVDSFFVARLNELIAVAEEMKRDRSKITREWASRLASNL